MSIRTNYDVHSCPTMKTSNRTEDRFEVGAKRPGHTHGREQMTMSFEAFGIVALDKKSGTPVIKSLHKMNDSIGTRENQSANEGFVPNEAGRVLFSTASCLILTRPDIVSKWRSHPNPNHACIAQPNP
jgi:hypothetical protein